MSVDIKNLDHLGLVAGIIDDLGVVEIVNNLLGEKKTEKVSAGTVVKAMILNGMGLISSPLYIFQDFFESQAIEQGASQKCKFIRENKGFSLRASCFCKTEMHPSNICSEPTFKRNI